MALDESANLFVLVSEGTVLSTFLIDGLSHSDDLEASGGEHVSDALAETV